MLHTKLLRQFYSHFAHYIIPGSQRIGMSKYTGRLETAAFRRPDGSLAVVLFNPEKVPVPVVLRMEGQIVELTVEAETILTAVVGQDAY